MQKNVNQGFYDALKLELDGKVPYGQNQKLGLNGGYVSYSITDTTKALFTAEQLAEIEGVAKAIADGTIDPGTAFGHEEGWFATFCDSVK